ncbi:hypothetical protein GLYMA_04G136650v4 [Glycine max]|nr:hypothetical protein GLYMA_04G136650v4 [Glycine max]KAH1111239.1 hypothetical protein GYH30_009854 [Glycine max]
MMLCHVILKFVVSLRINLVCDLPRWKDFTTENKLF